MHAGLQSGLRGLNYNLQPRPLSDETLPGGWHPASRYEIPDQ